MIKAIETEWGGYKFRSRLEARWAVFLDTCGADWEYEPEGYYLGDGLYYLPDFLLHHVAVRDYEHDNDCDVYLEVKGNMTERDALKIKKFNGPHCERKILVVGDIPGGKKAGKETDWMEEICDKWKEICDEWEEDAFGIRYYGFDTLDGDAYPAIPCATKGGRFGIVGPDWCEDASLGEDAMSWGKTDAAYDKARQARFEHDENPGRMCHHK